jgi:actin-related protein
LRSKINFSKLILIILKFKDVVGNQKSNLIQFGKESFVGDEAVSKRGILNFFFPMDHGVILNFDEMEKVWHHMFYNELRVAPEEYPLLMSEEITNTNEKREKTAQIMFEKFEIPKLFIEQSSVLSLYASGRTTGTVLSMGHTKNDVCCIYNASVLPNAEVSLFGGRDLTEFLVTKLNQTYSFKTRTEMMYANDIKEKMCFVSLNPDSEDFIGNREYELPDGNIIHLYDEIFQVPEVLFNPSLIGNEFSIQEMILNCIKSKDVELHDDFYKNILLTGGGTMFEGLSERLERELKSCQSNDIKVIAPPERKFSSWIGASILSTMSTFESEFINKKDFLEFGQRIVNFRCFNNANTIHRKNELNSIFLNLTKMVVKSTLTELNFSFS